jgi:hypothetical protein
VTAQKPANGSAAYQSRRLTRFGKIVRFGRARSVLSVDVFNALNTPAAITANQNFAVWNGPTSIPAGPPGEVQRAVRLLILRSL